MMKKIPFFILALLLAVTMSACGVPQDVQLLDQDAPAAGSAVHDGAVPEEPEVPDIDYSAFTDPGGFSYGDIFIPEWDGGEAWAVINDSVPFFDDTDLSDPEPFELYSELDGLGRCGQAYACLSPELMPDSEREDIGSVRPSGWHTVRYNGIVPGNYLYNRCHLIGFQLAGENANDRNLITGTRYLNIEGMLDFEDQVAGYIRDTGDRVLYRVTPVFLNDELVCRGVLLEARSVETDSVRFCVFAYNAQPGIGIDYATGDSWRLDGRDQSDVERELDEGPAQDFVLNMSSGKFHRPDCRHAGTISEGNRLEMREPLSKMLQAGYSPCGVCHPDE